MSELCSAVMILRPNRMKSNEGRFLGRVAHKLFLMMLNQVGYDDLAQQLHDLNAALPFTVSDLFRHGPAHYWLRITALNPQLCEILTVLQTQLPRQTILVPARDQGEDRVLELFVEMILLSHHEWASQTTYPDLIQQHWLMRREITLEFASPTVLKSLGIRRVFPEAPLLFRLLYDRWLKLAGENAILPFTPSSADLEQFVSNFVQVEDYELQCLPIKVKSTTIKAFQGSITYRLLSYNEDFHKRAERRAAKGDTALLAQYEVFQQHRNQYAALLGLLAEFAFYSGVGNHTGQGMGMLRRKG